MIALATANGEDGIALEKTQTMDKHAALAVARYNVMVLAVSQPQAIMDNPVVIVVQ